jgi:hypothetical protein
MLAALCRRAAALALPCSAIVSLCLGAAHAQTPRADRPTYAVGDTWLRDDGAYELVRIDRDVYVFSARNSKREVHLTRDLAIARVMLNRSSGVAFDPPLGFRWPLELGAKGQMRLTVDVLGRGQAVSATASWTVEQYQDVRTPDGDHKAFLIHFSISYLGGVGWAGGGSSRGDVRLWYAPAIGQFVRWEGRNIDVGLVDLTVLNFRSSGTGTAGTVKRVVPSGGPQPPTESRGQAPGTAEAVLEIQISAPQHLARVTQPTVPLAGVVVGKAVEWVLVALNGVELKRIAESPAPRVVPLNLPLKLSEGENTVVVTAMAADGTVRQDLRTITLESVRQLSVTYRIRGTASPVVVVYREPDGKTERRQIRVPFDSAWQLSFDAREGSPVYVAAETLDDGGSVTCEIIINDRTTIEKTVEGPRLSAICSGAAADAGR